MKGEIDKRVYEDALVASYIKQQCGLLLFSTATHSYQNLLARYILGHAMKSPKPEKRIRQMKKILLVMGYEL